MIIFSWIGGVYYRLPFHLPPDFSKSVSGLDGLAALAVARLPIHLPPGGDLTKIQKSTASHPVLMLKQPFQMNLNGRFYFKTRQALPAGFLRFCGRRWIRTTEGIIQQIYSLPHLATLVFSRGIRI